MKIIKIMILLASLFAIAGAAFFQLVVLLTSTLLHSKLKFAYLTARLVKPSFRDAALITRGIS